MPAFYYIAVERASGRERRGTIHGVTLAQVAAQLRAQGMAPIEVRPGDTANQRSITSSKGRRAWMFRRELTRKGLMLFTRQLATLVRAGLPIVRALEVLGRRERNVATKSLLEDLAEAIRSGGTLSDGLRRYPRSFDVLYINMVKAGESSGAFGEVLGRLTDHLEKAERLRSKVKSAMVYPAIIMVVATVIVGVLLVFVVPKFELILHGLLKGQPLPSLTRALMNVSAYLHGHVLLLAAAGLIGWLSFGRLRRTRTGARIFDGVRLKVPVLGELLLKATIARFARTLGSLLASGVPILDALAIARDSCGSVQVGDGLDRVRERVRHGATFSEPLEATGLFPAMVGGMVQVGEETGALPEMLTRLADAYDGEVDTAVAGLTSIIEPVMVVVMAVVVGVIVVALFLPIVSVIQHLQ